MDLFDSRSLGVIAGNLKENSKRLSDALEIRLGVLDSICDGVITDGHTGQVDAEILSMYLSSLKADEHVAEKGVAGSLLKRHIDAYSSSLRVADTLALSRMLIERAKSSGGFSRYELLEPDYTEQEFNDLRIVYRMSYASDIAFEKFASLIPDATAVFKDTFREVCSAVATGEADMCILPYENTDDGKLSSSYRLIESYELKIAASVLVQSDRRGDVTRYLLLSRSLSGLSMLSGVTDFEFSLTDRADGMLTRTLTAANLLSLEIRSVDTVRSEKGSTVYNVRVTADDTTLDEFILYLKLEAADFSPLGLYAVLDDEKI